jgi:glycosyltransferase involved in cell wall biosynthesis
MAPPGGRVKKKILLKAPVLTRSGYGEQSRFALRSLRSRPDLFEIFIQPLQWGQTSWISEEDEECSWINHTIEKTIAFIQHGGAFDASLQVTIPNEWEIMAPINIGFTAGMETTKVAHQWIQKGNEIDKILVVSDHSRDIYRDTVYIATHNQTGQQVEVGLETPIVTTNYPVKDHGEPLDLGIDLDYDFNFLVMAQFGPRKNLPNTVKWFIEEFGDEEVGLVVKTNIAKNCLMDRERLFNDMKNLMGQYPEHKCKVYLLHGDMTDKEIHSLFEHSQIKAFLTLSHGEGFGLPVFEAAYTGMPVIAPGWSGQLDFLVNKEAGTSEFYNVEYDIQPIPEEVVWDGVIVKESMWAYPREHSAKQQMRKCYADLTSENAEAVIDRTEKHIAYLREKFAQEKQYALMVSEICETLGINTETSSTEDVLEFD